MPCSQTSSGVMQVNQKLCDWLKFRVRFENHLKLILFSKMEQLDRWSEKILPVLNAETRRWKRPTSMTDGILSVSRPRRSNHLNRHGSSIEAHIQLEVRQPPAGVRGPFAISLGIHYGRDKVWALKLSDTISLPRCSRSLRRRGFKSHHSSTVALHKVNYSAY